MHLAAQTMRYEKTEATPPGAAATRDRIVAAAFALFLLHGYDGTGLSEILKRSGLSKGAFYHHFKTKEAVYREVVAKVFLKPLESYDFDAIAHHKLRDSRDVLAAAYDAMPANVAAMGVDLARYFALFFDALSRLDDFRDAVRAFYAQLLVSLAERTYAEREMPPNVADAHARNILAQFEGKLFLLAVFGDQDLPAMLLPPTDNRTGSDEH